MTTIVDFEGFERSLLQGSGLTLAVALLSLVLSLGFGLVTALAKVSSRPFPRLIATMYTTVVRGIPDLVLMLLFYFGGQIAINEAAEILRYEGYVDINPFVAGTVAIGFIYGAYMGESFRGAILAVNKGELEAGNAFGMSRWQVFQRILFPQMLRHALPSIGNNWLVLLKGTAIVSVIGLDDLVRKASLASGSTHKPFKFYFGVALVFLMFTTASLLVLRRAEGRFAAGFSDGASRA